MAEPNTLGESETTPPDTDQQNEPATEPNKKTTTRRKLPKIHLSREQWVAAGLLILTFELALCSILGSWRRVAAAHIALIAIILISFAIRAAVQQTKRRTGTGNTATRKLSDLLNPFRRTNGNTQPNGGRRNPFSNLFRGKGGPGSGAGGGRRNPFSGLFGSRKNPDGKSSRNPFSRLLSKRGKDPNGSSSRRNPFSNLFRGKGGPGSGAGGGRRNPFSKRGKDPNGSSSRGKGSPAGGAGGGRKNPLFNPFSKKKGEDKTEAKDKAKTEAKDKAKTEAKDKAKTEAKQDEAKQDEAKQDEAKDEKTEDKTEDKQQEEPVTSPANDGGVKVPASSGLHKWGRVLPEVEQEAGRLKARMKTLEAEIDAFATDVSALATIGETEQVKDTRTVVAQLQSIGTAVRKILASPASEMLAKIEGQASALWPTYSRDCAADEDRFQGARGTRRQERNADIGRAESDI